MCWQVKTMLATFHEAYLEASADHTKKENNNNNKKKPLLKQTYKQQQKKNREDGEAYIRERSMSLL